MSRRVSHIHPVLGQRDMWDLLYLQRIITLSDPNGAAGCFCQETLMIRVRYFFNALLSCTKIVQKYYVLNTRKDGLFARSFNPLSSQHDTQKLVLSLSLKFVFPRFVL